MVSRSPRHRDSATISATDAKNNFGAVLAQAQEKPVIIESRGHASAVVISVAEFEKYESAREEQRRREALERIRAIGAEAQRRNADLTPEEAQVLIDDIVDDTFARMIAEGKISYEG
jgi:prevent-host-death family protein